MKKESNALVILAIAILIIGVLGLASNRYVMAQMPTIDPNSIADPNAIKLPDKAKMPVRLKCAVHGIIGKAFIVIETDAGSNVYCSKCAKSFVAEVFNLNLPKLEVLQ